MEEDLEEKSKRLGARNGIILNALGMIGKQGKTRKKFSALPTRKTSEKRKSTSVQRGRFPPAKVWSISVLPIKILGDQFSQYPLKSIVNFPWIFSDFSRKDLSVFLETIELPTPTKRVACVANIAKEKSVFFGCEISGDFPSVYYQFYLQISFS